MELGDIFKSDIMLKDDVFKNSLFLHINYKLQSISFYSLFTLTIIINEILLFYEQKCFNVVNILKL